MSKRTTALVAALVLAAVATVALVSYVQSAGRSKETKQALVNVFVAKSVIPAGQTADTAISQGLIQQIQVPQLARSDDAITSLDQIKGKLAVVDIQKNEQILNARFAAQGSGNGQTGAIKLGIPSNLQAISIQVAIPPGAANFIQVGDFISVIGDVDITLPNGGTSGHIAGYLAQDVKVLAIGVLQTVPATSGTPATQQAVQPAGNVLVTLAVNPVQAQRLVLGTLDGQLYFTIVPANQKPANLSGRPKINIFGR
jgi:Flp pilus assembly protein CpaB